LLPSRAREARADSSELCDRAAPSRPTGSSRLYGCWSTSPFLFSGLLLAVWFGATMELGRSMMSAGAGAARATGSSTTDRKTALTAIAIHIEDAGKTGVFEVVLHADEVDGEEIYVPKFQEYLKSIGLNPPLKHRFYAGGLRFLELEGPRNKMRDVAAFSLVRAIRPMPPLRMLRPAIRTAGVPTDSVQLPNESPVDPKSAPSFSTAGFPTSIPFANGPPSSTRRAWDRKTKRFSGTAWVSHRRFFSAICNRTSRRRDRFRRASLSRRRYRAGAKSLRAL
jgi:hypothetical protein